MLYYSERAVIFFYIIIGAASLTCCVSSGLAWAYWRRLLNACTAEDCGCVLHGQETDSGFHGGAVRSCRLASFGPILTFIFAFVLGCYHGWRVYSGKGQRNMVATTISQKNTNTYIEQTEFRAAKDSLPVTYWLRSSLISATMAMFQLFYAVLYTNGFNATCQQFRWHMLKLIKGDDNIAGLIKVRWSCGAVFDAMDYLLANISGVRYRSGRIHTAENLYLTLVSCWIAVVAWLAILAISVFVIRRPSAARV